MGHIITEFTHKMNAQTAKLHCYLYPVLVILVTTWTVVHLVTETSSSGSHIEEVLPSSSSSPYTLGHMEEVLVGVEDWGRGIRMGKWNQSVIPVGRVHPYNEHWA